jgi:hypothetical protein
MTEGGVPASRDWGRRAFSARQRRIVSAVVLALFSSEGDSGLAPAPATLAERATDEFDLLIGAGSADLRRGYRLLVWLIEWLPIVVLGAVSRASRLPLARRLAYLDRLEHAKIGLLATLLIAFKLPLTMLVFELGDELRGTGFDRDTVATPRIFPRRASVEEVVKG